MMMNLLNLTITILLIMYSFFMESFLLMILFFEILYFMIILLTISKMNLNSSPSLIYSMIFIMTLSCLIGCSFFLSFIRSKGNDKISFMI